MIPWMDTAEHRIQVRPAYGTIPVAPGQHIIGWEVRVWHPKRTLPPSRMCLLCGRTVDGRPIPVAAAKRRPDFEFLATPVDGLDFRIAPYAHKCSAPVPWRNYSVKAEGWEHPHHHPTLEDGDVYDQKATPILYANAQLAYAAGLKLLDIDVPNRVHWKPAETA